MKIAIIGLGRVAMADALALARLHQVVMTGPLPDRIEAINRGEYGLHDPALDDYCTRHRLDLRAVHDTAQAIADAEMVFISAPLSRDPLSGDFNLVEMDTRIEFVARRAPMAPIVVRSAVPVGYCEAKRVELKGAKIVYAPEFCREGHMLSDNLYPKFLIVGDRHALGRRVLNVLQGAALRAAIPTRQMGLTEAELTRHLSIMMKAARVSYFNELDSYALHHGLDARQIIDGVCLDPRIGAHANNPCFGFGHGMLPLSTQSLKAKLDPARLPVLSGLEQAHTARSDALAHQITARKPSAVGIYQPGPTGPLPAALERLKQRLEAAGIPTRIQLGDAPALAQFKQDCEMVVTQRAAPELGDIRAKLFTRDHYARPEAAASAA
ncbi:MAG: hypothetical protein JJT99_07800 [Rhodobacteraceae bacterium]|nr:hypothetical protein [Paracoccaceae bacterium]